MKIQGGYIFTKEGVFRKGNLTVSCEKITELNFEPCKGTTTKVNGEQVIDAKDLYVLPGLVDIHMHGAVNVDFCDATTEELAAIEDYQVQNGVTTIFPATMTLPEEKLGCILETAANFVRQHSQGAIYGITMEGPFLSSKKRGAQEEQYICAPDVTLFKALQQKSGNLISQVAIAPEVKGAMEFIREISKEAVVSLAHSAADYETAKKAFSEGANHVTHLFNGMEPFLHREPGIVGAASDNHNVFVELICDGVHIHPAMVRAMFRLFGADRICMISDSISATGMVDGEYTLGGQKVIKKDKRATLENGTIAGSVCNLYECLKTTVLEMGIPLEEAILACTKTPAKSLKADNQCGMLKEGRNADILILDKDLNIKYVIKNGQIIIGNGYHV